MFSNSIGSNYINRHFYGVNVYVIHKIHTNVSKSVKKCGIDTAYLQVVFWGKGTTAGISA
jgi:hypothetical protein